MGLDSILSRQESILKEFLSYCQFEQDMEEVWNGDMKEGMEWGTQRRYGMGYMEEV